MYTTSMPDWKVGVKKAKIKTFPHAMFVDTVSKLRSRLHLRCLLCPVLKSLFSYVSCH